MSSTDDKGRGECQHIPTYGEHWYECSKCGKVLFRNEDKSPAAQTVAAEARRIVSEGFTPARHPLTTQDVQTLVVQIITQTEATLIRLEERSAVKAVSIPNVLQLLIGLRTQISRIELNATH
jgi:hypothetical protein